MAARLERASVVRAATRTGLVCGADSGFAFLAKKPAVRRRGVWAKWPPAQKLEIGQMVLDLGLLGAQTGMSRLVVVRP